MAHLKLLRFIFRYKELSVLSELTVSQFPASTAIWLIIHRSWVCFLYGFWTQLGNPPLRFTYFLSPSWITSPSPLLNFSSSLSNTNLTFSYEFYSTLISIHHYFGKILNSYIKIWTFHINEISVNYVCTELPFSSYNCISRICDGVRKKYIKQRYHQYVLFIIIIKSKHPVMINSINKDCNSSPPSKGISGVN